MGSASRTIAIQAESSSQFVALSVVEGRQVTYKAKKWKTLPSKNSWTVGNFSGSRKDLCFVRTMFSLLYMNLTASNFEN